MNKLECWFMEDTECYVVVGACTENQARAEIHKYERKECGLDEEELYPDNWELTPTRFRYSKNRGWVRWNENYKTGVKGWVGYI